MRKLTILLALLMPLSVAVEGCRRPRSVPKPKVVLPSKPKPPAPVRNRPNRRPSSAESRLRAAQERNAERGRQLPQRQRDSGSTARDLWEGEAKSKVIDGLTDDDEGPNLPSRSTR